MHYSSGPALPLRVTLTQGKSDPVPALRAPRTAKAPARSLQWSANEQLRGGIRAEKAVKQIAKPQAEILLWRREFCTAGLPACVWQLSPAYNTCVLATTYTLSSLNHDNTPRMAAVTPEEFMAHNMDNAGQLRLPVHVDPSYGLSHLHTVVLMVFGRCTGCAEIHYIYTLYVPLAVRGKGYE